MPEKSLTTKEAIIRVLAEAGKPLSSYDITTLVRKNGYRWTDGLPPTPWKTVGAVMYRDIKNNGAKSPFVQLGKNRFGLKSWDINVIKDEIVKKEREEVEEIVSGRKRSIVGDPINFEGLIYGPLNENGVIFLFSKMHEKFGIFVEAIQPSFPDAKARRKTRKGWEDVWIEFEYHSSSFKTHGHDPKECDLIVCWEHDWKDCPLEVIELERYVKSPHESLVNNPPETKKRPVSW